MGRPLRNYDIYLDKLKLYLEASEITLEYKNIDSDGIYIPSRRVIKLDPDMPESTEIATLLHECGHTTDDSLHNLTLGNKIDKAYRAFYEDRAGPKQKQIVIECEERAWKFSRGLAKKLRIPLGKWFDKEESEALNSYKESLDDQSKRAE